MSHFDDSSDLMEELTRQFIEEVGFMLEECEESILGLDQPARVNDELAKIFRVAHSVKGSAIALELTDLAGFAHVVEDGLSQLRAHPALLTADIVSYLLKANDAFKRYIDKLRTKSDEPWNVESLQKEFLSLNQAMMDQTNPAMIAARRAAAGAAIDVAPATPASAPVAETAHPSAAAPAATTAPVAAAAPAIAPAPVAAVPAPIPAPAAPRAASGDDSGDSKGGDTAIKVKVDAFRLDTVLDLVGELVVIKSQILQAFNQYSANNLRESSLLALFDKTVRDLQDRTLTMRMTSIRPIFLRAERIARDLSTTLQKKVEVHASGADIEIDRSMIELLIDPVVHIIRNSMDHGIESADVRKARGKPEKASLWLAGKQAGGRIVLEIRDDGNGINREKVFKRGLERGLIPANKTIDQMSEREVYDLLFMPGFSTAEKVTDISGRGVGLDVVKSNVEELKGTINVESMPGEGTTFRISLPLTTAITDGIVVLIEGIRVVVPIDNIREIVEVRGDQKVQVHTGRNIVNVRGTLLPMVQVSDVFGDQMGNFGKADQLESFRSTADELKSRKNETVMLLRSLDINFALLIGGVIGQSQVVVKPLGSSFRTGSGLSGAAVLGDGKVALVLDVDGLVKMMRERGGATVPGSLPAGEVSVA